MCDRFGCTCGNLRFNLPHLKKVGSTEAVRIQGLIRLPQLRQFFPRVLPCSPWFLLSHQMETRLIPSFMSGTLKFRM